MLNPNALKLIVKTVILSFTNRVKNSDAKLPHMASTAKCVQNRTLALARRHYDLIVHTFQCKRSHMNVTHIMPFRSRTASSCKFEYIYTYIVKHTRIRVPSSASSTIGCGIPQIGRTHTQTFNDDDYCTCASNVSSLHTFSINFATTQLIVGMNATDHNTCTYVVRVSQTEKNHNIL